MSKIAFVIPWYGLDIPGGSEAACRNLAEKMAFKGLQVEVLTTCVKQFDSDWNENYYQPGNEEINGVLVRRFKVRKRDTKKFDKINKKLMDGEVVSKDEELLFIREMVNSNDLEEFISNHKQEYKALVFTPYMFGTTFNGMKLALERAFLLPAFHNENYAFFQSFRELYSKVKGIMFYSSAERDWANAHYNIEKLPQCVIGLGIDQFQTDPSHFREKYDIQGPYILYAGRKDRGKNIHTLLDFFSRYHQAYNTDLKLVLIGGGKIDIPKNVLQQVIDLGFVNVQDKYNAYAGAELLCNPSANESFSIVIMESWYAGRPVLVNEECEVTKRFCEESNGGLYFNDYQEFAACIELVLNRPNIAKQMGTNGQAYVKTNFTWNHVIDKYVQFIFKYSEGEFE